eukprot:5012206-Prymnesium_polylepis.1
MSAAGASGDSGRCERRTCASATARVRAYLHQGGRGPLGELGAHAVVAVVAHRVRLAGLRRELFRRGIVTSGLEPYERGESPHPKVALRLGGGLQVEAARISACSRGQPSRFQAPPASTRPRRGFRSFRTGPAALPSRLCRRPRRRNAGAARHPWHGACGTSAQTVADRGAGPRPHRRS